MLTAPNKIKKDGPPANADCTKAIENEILLHDAFVLLAERSWHGSEPRIAIAMETFMSNKKISLSLLLLLVPGLIVAGHQREESQEGVQVSPATQPEIPSAEVSLVTVDPTGIFQIGKPEQTVASVSVQIFHQSLKSEEAVTLSVGTYRTDPQRGVSASYEPSSQTIRLPPGNAGKINATAKVSNPQIGANMEVTVTIVADIKPASSGIRIRDDDPGLPNHQAILKIKKQATPK